MTVPLRAGEPILVNVALGARSYEVVIGRGQLASLGRRMATLRPGAKAAIVSDEIVARHHLGAAEASLAAANLKGCNLRDARLDAADFTDAVLRLCDLDQARASGASFVRTRLENGSARGARFEGADLTGAILTDTDFSRASLRGAMLDGASATGARGFSFACTAR